jgi:hypothetical protein
MRQNGSKLDSRLKPYKLYIEYHSAQRGQCDCSLLKANMQERVPN